VEQELRLRSVSFAVVASIVALAHAPALGAQDTPPPALTEVENARSRTCVGALDRLGDLNMRLEPLGRRAARLRTLSQAIALEDSTRAAPFAAADPVEAAVRAWFERDLELGSRFAETGDSTIAPQRAEAKAAIRQRLQQDMDSLRARADSESTDADEIQAAAMPCQGAVLVRPAVMEECRATSNDSQVCAAAADTSQRALFRFVNAAEDLWNIEELRPWSDPGPLQVAPDGSLVGARTAARSRLGNVVLSVALAPLIQERSQVDSAQAAEFDANLDSLGITFDVPRFVMAPALEIQANLPAPLGGETHYLLHFGEPGAPEIVWSMPADSGGVVQAVVPLSGDDLNKLQAGEPLSLTAVKMAGPPVEGQPPQAEFVYSLSLLQVGESRAATALLDYMAHGRLAEDLKRITSAG
jgi:hypothetical protein